MHERKLGRSGLVISEIGLGCWQLGGDFGPIDTQRVEGILAAAQEAGITFYDTADVYGAGASESYLGRFIANTPNAIIATKYGRGGDCFPNGYTFNNMLDSVKRSQDRLRRDQLDLLQLHCIPREVMARGEVFDWLRRLQEDGHIKHFGASVETAEEGLLCLQQDGLASLQIIFNIFRQKPLDELLPAAQDAGVGIIVRLPLASGMLSGKFTQQTRFDETDHRNFNRDGQMFNVGETFAGIPFEVGVQLVQRLEGLVPEGYTMAQMAMRWILDNPAVSTIIPGASSPTQVVENARVSELEPLSSDLHDELSRFYRQEVAQHIRGAY